ncbi:hypothetical protein N9C10_03600 [Flavobacteriaceae bacterium]|nr:hypothetical protein [Flavobacteriaceae bacterium]
MIKKICKTPLHCVAFLIVCIVILTVLSPRTESLGSHGSGSGTTSGGSSWGGATGTVGAPAPGGGSTIPGRAYGFQAFLSGAQNSISPPGYRVASTWHGCSPESHPYGCSSPEMSLTVPGRGPFPYPMNW